jgi:hypothetical protein
MPGISPEMGAASASRHEFLAGEVSEVLLNVRYGWKADIGPELLKSEP